MITILDGGMGSELIRREVIPRGDLWSAQALIDAPDSVLQVHRDYIAAGAEMIITNSYSTIPSYLGKLGLQDRYEELTALAGSLARQAANEADHAVQVAASLPPLDESYRPDLAPEDAKAMPIYRALAQALNPYADLFLCETMSCIREAVNAASAAREIAGSQKPVYVSWTLAETPGTGLRSGESISDAVLALARFDIGAYLFNCTSPEAITQGLAELRTLTDRPMGAYPNRMSIPEGWTLDNEVSAGYRVDLDVAAYIDYANRWTQDGASFIGGCCGIGPEYIRALRDAHIRPTS
ncbi:MAG: homocysteine S-methyltransferase family protein [Pseudomonadales bacterium]